MGSELLCPRCNLPLKEVLMSHGVFWTCDKCAGRAVTVELLRRTFTPESINPLWLHAIGGEGRSGRLCPSCRKPMIEVALSDSANVISTAVRQTNSGSRSRRSLGYRSNSTPSSKSDVRGRRGRYAWRSFVLAHSRLRSCSRSYCVSD